MTAQLSRRASAGLRVRLLAVILILIIPIAAFVTVGLLQVKTTRIRIAQERAYEVAKAGAARFQDTIDDIQTVLDILSRVPEVTNGSPDACARFLRDTAIAHQWARSLSLIGEDQKVACSTSSAAVGFDVSDRPWFQEARKKDGFSVSGFFINQVSGMPTTFAARFFHNSLNQRPQALIASLDLGWFDHLAATFGEKQNVLVLLTDHNGVILARYPQSPIPGNARLSEKFLGELTGRNEALFSGMDPDGKERLFGSVPIPQARGHVIVGFDREQTLGLIMKYTMIAALLFGVLLPLAGLVVWIIGDKIFVRPIEELSGLLRTTLDTMDQGLIAVDRNGRSSIMNERALDLLGLPREFAATRPYKDDILNYQRSVGEFSSEEQYATVVRDIDERRHTNYERERPNGTVLEIRTVPTADGGFVRTYTDITARRRIEAALRRERDRAEAAARATTEFLANMSHELRTPLTAIIGVSDMLLSGSQSPGRQRHFMEMQRNAGQGLLSVINNILDLSKIEAGQLDLETAPFSLREVAQGCIGLMSEQAGRKGLELTAAIAEDVQEHVLGDAARLRQIVLNLVANGVKFTPSGRVALTIDRAPGDAVRFAVTDTGIGIRAEAISTIFQRFAQADGSTTRRFGGTGLGLAISKRLVDLMGGSIEVESEPGRGSTFSFSIPLPACLEARPESRPPLPESRRCYRLLLAEDNAVNQQLIKAMLEQAGHEVWAVNDGAEAVRTAVRNRFDAILMDVQMPDMDGYAATRAIRSAMQDGATVPIIALTANALSDEADRCLAAGMTVHVAKPVHWPTLFATIDRLVLESSSGAPDEPSGAGDSADEVAGWSADNGFDEAAYNQLRRAIGDESVASLIKLFVADARQRFLADAASREAREWLCQEAHTLGGSAGMLGFDNLARACMALQSAGPDGDQFDPCLHRCRKERDAALARIERLTIEVRSAGPEQSIA